MSQEIFHQCVSKGCPRELECIRKAKPPQGDNVRVWSFAALYDDKGCKQFVPHAKRGVI